MPETLYQSIPVLLVDDDRAVRRSIRRVLEGWGCSVDEAGDGNSALEQLCVPGRRLVLTDIDMPSLDGFDLLDTINQRFPQCGVIMVSGMSHEKIIDAALERGAIGYIQKPFRLPELKAQVTNALRRMTQAQGVESADRDAAREFARMFAATADLHHVETGDHIRRIGRLSRELALRAGLRQSAADLLGEAAVLHDIGKLAIPDAILKKAGPLTPEEFAVMRTHPVLGAQILQESRNPMLQLAYEVCLHHHERWDGMGYPHGLRGENCSIEARIVGIVDVYDALTEKRVYKEAWPLEKVVSFFEERAGTAFDPHLVGLLIGDIDSFEAVRLAADNVTALQLSPALLETEQNNAAIAV
ncbi:MAG: HD domain-containing phosphohydrolase [Spirochaetota bacterium]